MRDRFNSENVWQRAIGGEFALAYISDKPIDRTNPRSVFEDDPLCARSQVIRYLDSAGSTVAVVHQYIRADGGQCANGRPDPKALLIDSILYILCPSAP